MYDEANFIRERESTRIITEAQLLQLGAGSILNKKAGTQFSKMVKTLNVEAKPIPGRFD